VGAEAQEMQRWGIRVAVALACLVVVAGSLYKLAKSRTTQLLGRLVVRVETSKPVVALTFDDGPTPIAVDEIINSLGARNVRATFFVTGSELARNPEAGHRLVAAGHELGNHTFSHDRMVLKSYAFIRSEIERTDALIRAAGHVGPIHFRAPFCKKLLWLPWFLWRTDRTSVTWDVEPDSYGDVSKNAERITAHVLERARPGSIILLHVWYPSNAPARAAIPGIVDGLRARGFRLVTVNELLALAPPASRKHLPTW
jgi:peptidoglycan/xylan/chitin deacetylase (PgdA/CDA1 family)